MTETTFSIANYRVTSGSPTNHLRWRSGILEQCWLEIEYDATTNTAVAQHEVWRAVPTMSPPSASSAGSSSTSS